MPEQTLESVSIILALTNMQSAEALKSALVAQHTKKVFVAADNREAVAQLDEQFYNMVFIEEGFPQLGGADFCRFLRMVDGPLGVAPIIYGIIVAETDRVFAARDAGASKIVLMPLSPKTLIETIQSVIREMRPFIQAMAYRGPDRRLTRKPFHGPDKRSMQIGLMSILDQKKIIGSF